MALARTRQQVAACVDDELGARAHGPRPERAVTPASCCLLLVCVRGHPVPQPVWQEVLLVLASCEGWEAGELLLGLWDVGLHPSSGSGCFWTVEEGPVAVVVAAAAAAAAHHNTGRGACLS